MSLLQVFLGKIFYRYEFAFSQHLKFLQIILFSGCVHLSTGQEWPVLFKTVRNLNFFLLFGIFCFILQYLDFYAVAEKHFSEISKRLYM